MRKLTYTLLLALAVMFTSCQQTKEGVIADLNNLIEQIEKEGAEYTESDWEDVNKEFEEFCKEAEELTDWSAEETAEFAKAKAKYLAVQVKKNSENIMKKAGKAIEGFMEGLED